MKLTSIVTMTVIGGTLAGSLVLAPTNPTAPESTSLLLPATGAPGGIIRIKHPLEIESIPAPVEVYAQYVPPPVTQPAPAASAPRASTPPAGTRRSPCRFTGRR